jgi:hypothetical protein
VGPALDEVGGAFVTMVIFETEAAQEEKLTDHVSTVVPVVSPVIVVLFRVGVVIVPDPETLTHNPVPTMGTFPAKNAEPPLEQMVWLGPASAVEGPTVKLILEFVEHVPLVMVHMKVLMPAVKPVIVVVGRFGAVITPDPEIFVHVPIPPPVAVFAAINGAAAPTHKVLLAPAFAI